MEPVGLPAALLLIPKLYFLTIEKNKKNKKKKTSPALAVKTSCHF